VQALVFGCADLCGENFKFFHLIFRVRLLRQRHIIPVMNVPWQQPAPFPTRERLNQDLCACIIGMTPLSPLTMLHKVLKKTILYGHTPYIPPSSTPAQSSPTSLPTHATQPRWLLDNTLRYPT